MRFTKDVEYALISLIAMEGTTELISARDIADEYDVPYDRLSKILQRLASADVLESVKGAHGGYRLTIGAEELTLRRVIDAVQGVKRITPCLDDEGCVRADVCNIKESIIGVQSLWEDVMGSVTLAQFSGQRTEIRNGERP